MLQGNASVFIVDGCRKSKGPLKLRWRQKSESKHRPRAGKPYLESTRQELRSRLPMARMRQFTLQRLALCQLFLRRCCTCCFPPVPIIQLALCLLLCLFAASLPQVYQTSDCREPAYPTSAHVAFFTSFRPLSLVQDLSHDIRLLFFNLSVTIAPATSWIQIRPFRASI